MTDVNKNISKIMSFGTFNYEFSANFTESELKALNINLSEIKTISDVYKNLKNDGFRKRIIVNSKNNLINLLFYLNKTNPIKTYIEFFSLNSLFLPKELYFMKPVIRNEFNDNMLFITESNILPPSKLKFNISVESNEPITFEIEFNEINEKERNSQISKKDLVNTDDKSKTNNAKANENNINNPKVKNDFYNDKSIRLPSIEKPITFNIESRLDVEGKDEEFKTIDVNEIKKDNKSIIMFTRKTHQIIIEDHVKKEKIDSNKPKTYEKVDLQTQLEYDFETCSHLILDLNFFTKNKFITLDNLYLYINNNLIMKQLKTIIIIIFPDLEFINKSNNNTLINLINLADIILFDRKDAVQFCTSLGHQEIDTNLELRLMYLNEFKINSYKTQRMFIFLDCFNKITSIIQDNKSSLLVFNQEHKLNIGLKMEYFKIISNNFELLKNVFYGAFLSKVIQKESFSQCFEAAEKTFIKLLDCYVTNPHKIQVEIDYFLYQKVSNQPKVFSFNNYGPVKQANSQIKQEIAFNSKSIDLSDDVANDNFTYLRKSNKSNDARLYKILENNLLSSLEINNFISVNILKGNKTKSNKHKLEKLPQSHLLNQLGNINKNRLGNTSLEGKKKLKPIKNIINSQMNINPQDRMNFMNQIIGGNSHY